MSSRKRLTYLDQMVGTGQIETARCASGPIRSRRIACSLNTIRSGTLRTCKCNAESASCELDSS
jgi:hypothetical protein